MGYDGFYHHAMFGPGDGGWWMPMGIHGLFSVLLIGGIAFAVYFIVRYALSRHSSNPANDPALLILGQQYASGDLSRNDYLQKRKDLKV